MQVTACLLDGFKIVGFEIMNNKGIKKNLSYEKTLVFAQQKKLDGISYRKVNSEAFLVGLDYSNIEKRSIQTAKFINVNMKDDKINSVLLNINDKELEVSLGVFYNLLLNSAIEFDDKDIENQFKIGVYKGNKCMNYEG